MKKKWILIFGFLGIALVFLLLNWGKDRRTWVNGNCWEATTYYSKGVLSTGHIYEFRGEFDFNEFRRHCHYYLERATGETLIAETPKEVAELAQVHLFPGLRSLEDSMERPSIFFIYYCPETNNWVIERRFPEGVVTLGMYYDNIFSINRSSGNVVEFARHHGDGFIIEWLDGWRRTIR